MTMASASYLDDIRSRLCDLHDLLTLAVDASTSPDPEWIAVRLARQLTDTLVGEVDAPCPVGGADNAWADLKDALVNLAASGADVTSLRVSFATRSSSSTATLVIPPLRTSGGLLVSL